MTTVLRLNESHRAAPALDLKDQTLGRRVAIRRWFHSLYREEPDDEFDGDECISSEEAESLVMVPSFNLAPARISTNSTKDASTDKKETHRRREKIRDFKIHIKVKFSHLKHRHERSSGHEPINHKDTNVSSKDSGQRACTIEHLFGEGAKQTIDSVSRAPEVSAESVSQRLEDASTSDNTTNSDNTTSNGKKDSQIITVQQLNAGSPAKELSTDLSGSRRMKRQSNHEEADKGSNKRPRSGKEVSTDLSAENVEDNSSCEESESSIYMNSSPTSVDPEPKQSVPAPQSTDSTPDQAIDSSLELNKVDTNSMDSSDDFSSSEGTSFSDEFSATEDDIVSDPEPCVSPDVSEKVYSIPTFRKKVRSLNVANIVRSFREGTLNEDRLIEIANKGVDGHGDLTFKNKEFYDDPASKPSDLHKNEEKDNQTGERDSLADIKDSAVMEDQKPVGTVKFDRFSCLIVYETSANPSSLKHTESVSLRGGQCTVRMKQNTKCSQTGTKSILKVKSNSRAKEENKRANDCDRVAVDSFMDLFEHFEHKKQMEECMLAEVREGQLNNYFSENFFPEILEDATIITSANSEYSRSRKATELNIGRKLGAINCGLTHYICESCDTPAISRSVRSKRL